MTNDILAKRIADLERQLSTAKAEYGAAQIRNNGLRRQLSATIAERDALAAHNSELVSACKLATDMFVANGCNVPNTIETLQDAIDATPQQCLRDVQAKAGRAGWNACIDWLVENSSADLFTDGEADQARDVGKEYAESVRRGGAE